MAIGGMAYIGRSYSCRVIIIPGMQLTPTLHVGGRGGAGRKTRVRAWQAIKCQVKTNLGLKVKNARIFAPCLRWLGNW